MPRKSLAQIEAEQKTLNDLKNSLHVVMRGSDQAIRIEEWDEKNCAIGGGEWASYRGIATFAKAGYKFFAVSDYYNGVFPVEKVLEWR